VQIGDDDRRTFAGEPLGDGTSDPRPATSDDRDSVGQVHGEPPVRVVSRQSSGVRRQYDDWTTCAETTTPLGLSAVPHTTPSILSTDD
jgi:hypothetical protein